ncbi:phosphatidylglycerophosphatase A family protein [Denitromonas ohlonensis]|uniref:Phosphatidylglycerophosphatase A n=2 Tax=Denitromonas TaxID=139331 RepID=A0A558EZE1_9RHOO|nr:phosphatidylglycerophosphatase A [Denitromonas ohlonensis]TVT47372.1 MAG: phosphatidylglycerophosphatase A [Denitromonas halophila]TVO64941.1 phosphatidylglycerophosphatase A [Denitromonas ohlonensis]TVO75614.1 phosphatidylglycerophosphatase A [Denitromonas ohlonensis]TVT71724.1 MAG: phosphatidylglycerophosphatase A [Denitromonas halophila]TVT78726.1 MAG: phosphatidylglycerophosphatase A [Denitromonas halophila]
MRPTVRFLFAKPAHFIALGFGSGLSPKAPGTAGTLAAWLLFPLLASLNGTEFLVFVLSGFVLGVIVSDRTGRALGVSDHGSIVWDEILPFWVVLYFTPDTLAWQTAAFVAFRFFDIVKPQPIKWADSKVKGGFGVMLDDVIAAGYTLLVLALAARALAL